MKIDEKVILELEKEGISEEFFTAKRIYRKKGKLISEEVVPTPTKKHSKSSRLLSYIMLFIGIIGLGVGIWGGLGNDYEITKQFENQYVEQLNISHDEVLIMYASHISESSHFSVGYVNDSLNKNIYVSYYIKMRTGLGKDGKVDGSKCNIKLGFANKNVVIPVKETAFINILDYLDIIDKEYITIEYQYYDVNYKFKLYIDYEQLQINLANKYTE